MPQAGARALLTPSARHRDGQCYVIFNPAVLSSPRVNCMLTYRLKGQFVVVGQRPGKTWRRIPIADL